MMLNWRNLSGLVFASLLVLVPALIIGGWNAASAEDTRPFGGEHHDFFALLYPSHEDLSFNYHLQPDNNAKDSDGGFDLNQFDLSGELLSPLNGDQYLRFGGAYGARVQDFDNVNLARTETGSKTFQKLNFLFGGGMFLDDDLLLTGYVQPGIYGDLSGSLERDDLRIFGGGELVYRMNPGAELVAGLEVSERYDDYPFLPLVGLRLVSGDGHLHLSATFPTEIRVGYNFDPQLEIYGGGWVTGDEYEVSMGKADNFRASVRDNRVGVGGVYWVSENFSLKLEAGVAIEGEFKLKTTAPGQFESGDLDTTGYLAAGAGVAF